MELSSLTVEAAVTGAERVCRRSGAQFGTSCGRMACWLCAFPSPYHRRAGESGGPAGGNSAVVFLEDVYLLDEGTYNSGSGVAPLCLGADCSVCKQPVCVGCSAFFTRRFCFGCIAAAGKSFSNRLAAARFLA